MAAFERLALVYFLALAAAALASHATWRRRLAVLAAAAAIAAAVYMSSSAPFAVRAWLAHAWLLLGYWVPALLVPHAVAFPTPFEQWLTGTDAWLRRRLPSLPRALVLPVELAYLFCYPLVPVSFVIVLLRGGPGDVDRFWTAVLAAGYASYVSIPWLISRPPRLAPGAPHTPHAVAALNVFVLGRVSHGLTTFPSGHVSVSCAAAAMLLPVSMVAGVIVGVVAAAVAAGAAAGRYHFVIDVLLGAVLAAGAGLTALGVASSY